jgi:hypothetical protein
MKRLLRLLAGTVILIATSSMYGCDAASGIGVGVPVGGSRWEGGGAGPGVIVMGGPVYR